MPGTQRILSIIVTVLILILISSSCATLERAAEEMRGTPDDPSEEVTEEEILEFTPTELLLYENRTHMADRFFSIQLEIPETFLRQSAMEQAEVDPTAGYRVQLVATRDVAYADSVRDEFRVWALERVAGYSPEAYIFFRQPYYRVRVGDFNNRRKAIDFSNMLKGRYPEAWVVHDRIDPELVPADTVNIRIRSSFELLGR